MTNHDEQRRDAAVIADHLQALRRILRRPFETDISSSGLTPPQVQVLRALAETDGLSLKELSQRVGLAHSTVSGIVDRLMRQELVQRQPDAVDRRFVRIALTERVGTYLQTALPAQRLNPLAEALQRARPDERAIILSGLSTLRRLLEGAESNVQAQQEE